MPVLAQIIVWHRTDATFDLNRRWCTLQAHIQYIPRNMHTVTALLCFVVVIHWLIFPYPSGLLHWHCGNLTIAPVPTKQPWWIWINASCEFIMNDCITTTKQSTTKPCAYFLGYTVRVAWLRWVTADSKRYLICIITQVHAIRMPPYMCCFLNHRRLCIGFNMDWQTFINMKTVQTFATYSHHVNLYNCI